MKKKALQILPWVITIIALYLAFRGIDWKILLNYLKTGNILWLSLAVVATFLSYIIRSFRWQFFFPTKDITFLNSYKVLILGFFMNNLLPARAGELVRAHLGSKVTNFKRTQVLASIASERLADGLVLSFFFLLVALTTHFSGNSKNLFYVVFLFILAAILIILTLIFKNRIFTYLEKINLKLNKSLITYAIERIKLFIDGLKPMFSRKRFPILSSSSFTVWLVELLAYYLISQAFNAELSFAACVVFLVAINFSSLIPAAPAGIGVIEAVATAILVAIGIEKELALSMVISQHIIQILVIGIQGALIMLTWNLHIKDIQNISENA